MRTSDSLGPLALGVTMGAKLWSWGETRGPLADGGGERISVYLLCANYGADHVLGTVLNAVL